MSVNTRVHCLLRRVHAIHTELSSSEILPLGGLALPPLTGIALHSDDGTTHGRRQYQPRIPPRPIFPPGTSSHKRERYNEMVELLQAVINLSDPSPSQPLPPRAQRYLGDHIHCTSIPHRRTYMPYGEAWSYYVAVFEGMAASCGGGQGIEIALEPVGPMACCAPFFICSSRKATAASSNRQPSSPLRFLLSTTRPVPPSSLLHALQRHLLSVNVAHSTYTPTPITTATHANTITGLNLFPASGVSSLSSGVDMDGGGVCYLDGTPQFLVPCEVEVVPYHLLYVRVLLDSSPPELLYQCFSMAHTRGLSIHRAKGVLVTHPDLAKPHLTNIRSNNGVGSNDGVVQVVPTSLRELVSLLGVSTMAESHFPSIVPYQAST